MTRYVAFLRGINVGGHALVKMSDLKAAFSAAGCLAVKTYIQSGNVIFDAPEDASATFKKIQARLRPLFREEPVVIYRTSRELERMVRSDPFKTIDPDGTIKRYVTFLLVKPKVKLTLPLGSAREAIEAIAIRSLDLFLVSRPTKDGRYGFPNLPIEKQVGVPATSRNWNTLSKIVELTKS